MSVSAGFPENYAVEVDGAIQACGNELSFEGAVLYLDGIGSDSVARDITERKEEFLTWFVKRSKHSLLVQREWLGMAPTPSPPTEKESHSSLPPPATPAGAQVPTTPSTTALPEKSSLLLLKRPPLQQLHWYTFMCKLLREAITHLDETYVAIWGDLIRRITENGRSDAAAPHFSFVVYPKEKVQYQRMQEVLAIVIENFRQRNIIMSNGLKGSVRLITLPDGRCKFCLFLDKRSTTSCPPRARNTAC